MVKIKPVFGEKAEKYAEKYYEAVGRRKAAVARVRLAKGSGIKVNDRDYISYFPVKRFQRAAEAPLHFLGVQGKFSALVKVKGGGLKAQAEAIRHAIARALVVYDESFKKKLRRVGYLTRDSRMVERKKYGLKKARRAPQWAKR